MIMKPILRTFILCIALQLLHLARSEEWHINKNAVLFEAIVSDTKIRVLASERAFDPSAHRVTELHNAGTEENPNWIGATIDGKSVIGADQTLPPKGLPQLAQLTVYFGDKRVDVPQKLLNYIFLPHLSHEAGNFSNDHADTIISVSRDAKCAIVDLGVGDGGGASSTVFVISVDGSVSTEYPKRPEP